MANGYYVLDGREARQASDAEWLLQSYARRKRTAGDHDPWRIGKRETIGDAEVSTVFLGLDYSYGDGPPLIFETMIFGGDYGQHQWRYSTYDEAEAGHAAVVESLRNGTKPPGYEDED